MRFATAAALIAFGGIIGAGAIALVPAAIERIPAIRAEGPPASACDPQTRLPWDRNCQAATAAPQEPPAGTAPREAANAAAAEVPPLAGTTEAPPPARAAEVSPPAPTTPEPSVRDNGRSATPRQAAAGEPSMFTPSPLAPPTGGKPSTFSSSQPAPPAATEKPPAATPAVAARPPRQAAATRPSAENETAPRPSAANESAPRAAAAKKKASRQEQAAKRSTSEALGVVRRFGETLPEIPVRSYAPDGTQRTIVIRPTNIQDSYYYSAPR
ncbi:MAG: hypothetical protein ABWY47_11200 [Xanthobacteraceae bacterium]